MKKKTVKIGVAVIALFLLYNVFWFASTHIAYNEYIKDLPRNYIGSYGHFATDEDPYNYGVRLPGWLDYEGNLSVNYNDKDIGLFIWPSVFKSDMKYGVRIVGDSDEDSAEIMVNSKGEVSKNEGYRDEEIQMYTEILKKHHEEIKELCQVANQVFGISLTFE